MVIFSITQCYLKVTVHMAVLQVHNPTERCCMMLRGRMVIFSITQCYLKVTVHRQYYKYTTLLRGAV